MVLIFGKGGRMVGFSRVSVGYGGQAVLSGVSFTAPKGRVTALIGPNGCGKTTLLKTACGLLAPVEGDVTVGGKSKKEVGRKEWARLCALLPQVRETPALTVEELAAHGRYPHLAFGRKLGDRDRAAIERALEETGLGGLGGRSLGKLSGGERQRAYLAMALAQDPQVFFLDEPTTYLDVGQKYEMLGLVRRLRDRGKTVVMVLHDLPLAFSYSDYVAVLGEGRLLAFGESREVFDSGVPGDAFGVKGRKVLLDGQEEFVFTKM